MDKQLVIRLFAAMLIAGSLAFYLGKHYDRQFASAFSNPFPNSPFAPMKAGAR
jgi:hypothetical protein